MPLDLYRYVKVEGSLCLHLLKWQLNQFSRFREAYGRDYHTDREADGQNMERQHMQSNRSHLGLCYACYAA